ncbi:MAG: UDP-glucose/GDP-mannose dehydrogenase family protein [Candidatus Bathyarchaeota archaeon]
MEFFNLRGVSVVGTGFVGLVTATCFVDKGYVAYAYDSNHEKAEMVRSGRPPFYEPNLESLLKKGLERSLFKCVNSLEEAVLKTDVTFICVGTPSKADGSIDLTYIETSAEEIGKALAKKSDYHVVVVKSTVVPGTTQNRVKPQLEKSSHKVTGKDFGLCMSPEFLKEGSAVNDTFNPDRVVIGEYDKKSGDFLEKVFLNFYGENSPPILRMNLASGEMVKYASNAFLATKISFINEIANICERVKGLDVAEIAKGMGLDQRIGPRFLQAGLGFGGSCFPKDVKALISFSQGLGYEPQIVKSVFDVNERQAIRAVELAKQLVGSLKDKRVALLGLAFKPDTSDIREAPSLKIIRNLLAEGAVVAAYDPAAMSEAEAILDYPVEYAVSSLDCIERADCCIVVTEWEEFKKLNPEDFLAHMQKPVVIDGRKIYDPEKFRGKLVYAAVGLGE